MLKPAWMRRALLFAVLPLLLCIGGKDLNAQAPIDSGVIGRKAVWAPTKGAQKRIAQCNPASVECLTSVMRQSGASSQAVQFATLLNREGDEGYMTSFRRMGRVDLVAVIHPFRANTNFAYWLVNGTPPVLETTLTGENQENTDEVDQRKRIDIKTDPLYSSVVKRFPELDLETGRNTFENMRRLPEGGQEFVFSFPLVNGCRACEIGGYAHVGFDFDPAGNFSGAKLLRLSRAHHKSTGA
jgi:hypothetical protein